MDDKEKNHFPVNIAKKNLAFLLNEIKHFV